MFKFSKSYSHVRIKFFKLNRIFKFLYNKKKTFISPIAVMFFVEINSRPVFQISKKILEH